MPISRTDKERLNKAKGHLPQEKAMDIALKKIENVANEFKEKYGRYCGGLIDCYALDDAEIVIMAMGSVIGTIKDTIDVLRYPFYAEDFRKIGMYRWDKEIYPESAWGPRYPHIRR